MFEFVSAASFEFSNLMLCGFGSVSCCKIQNLTVVTSHENFGLVQESFKDLLSIFWHVLVPLVSPLCLCWS